MDRSEKRKWKRRKREYVRQEKESVRRERRHLRKKIRRERKKRFVFFLNDLFKKSHQNRPETEQLRKRRKRRSIAGFFRFWFEDVRRKRQERLKMKEKLRPVRERIRKARREKIIKETRDFFSNPFPRRRKSKSQEFILREIRRERRMKTRKFIIGLPIRFVNSIYTFWYNRVKGIISLVDAASSFLKEFREATSVRQVRKSLLVTMANSTVFFVFAFLAMYFTYQYVTIVTASFFDIPAVLYSYRIYWPLYTYSTLYTRAALILIFGAGPALCLIFGFLFFRLFIYVRNKSHYLKMFLIWLIFHSFNLFFGSYIVGVVTRTGFIYTSEWLFLSNVFDVEEIVLLIISIVVLIIAGYYSTRHIIMATVSNDMIEPKRRVFYIIFQLLIPWFLGNLGLFIMNAPNNPSELVFLYFTSLLIIIPVFSNFNTTTFQQIRVLRTPKRITVRWVFLAAVIALMILARVGLNRGISFG